MRNVVIDLGNLEYLYSDTINAFIASNRHMLEVSGRIAILTEHPKVQDILKRAGLDNIMRIYRSEAEMIADSKEILRQTSSYRVDEIQKAANQAQDIPQAAKTEFDEFKAEMGQRLGTKLDNNELPQYQLGVSQNPPSTAPSFDPNQQHPHTPYPNFSQQNFPAPQVPEAPPMYPQGIPGQVYNTFNNPAFGMGQAPAQPVNPQAGNPPAGNFEYPTVQLPIGNFGSNIQQPPAGAGGPNYAPDLNSDNDDSNDPRSRKSADDRMRSPNARRQQGRRAGGRENPNQESENVLPPFEQTVYREERRPEPAYQEKEEFIPATPTGNVATLAEEKKSGSKIFALLLLVAAILGGGFWYLSQKNEGTATKATPSQSNTNVTETTPPAITTVPDSTKAVTPAPAVLATPATTTPVAPAPMPASAAVKAVPSATVKPAPVAATPKPAAVPMAAPKVTPLVPTPKPIAEKPAPKVAKVVEPSVRKTKPAKLEKTEKAPVAKVSEEPAASASKGLHITSNPSGADVLVNFSKKGNTPLDVVLTNNSNKIIVRLPGYKRFETTLPKNHPERELVVDLDKEEGAEQPAAKAVPEPTPQPVAAPAKPAPKPAPKVEPKPVQEEKQISDPEDLPMAKSKPEKVEKQPEPVAAKPATEAPPAAPGDGPIGIIFLSSSPARADILVDGKNTGKKTPAKLELPSGNHRIEMSKSGQKNSLNLVVNEGKNKAVHLTLQ